MQQETVKEKEQVMYHYGLIEEAIERRYATTNRRAKRPAEKEYKRIVEIIYAIELNFVNDVFNSEHTDLSYNDVYDFYHKQYENNVMYIVTKLKPKFFALDRKAFSRKFRPQV